MLIQNKGKAFDILFNGDEYHVPEGKFEVTESLGLHIQQKANEWDMEVEIIDGAEDRPTITQISPVQEPAKEESAKEEVKETKEDVKETKDEKPEQTKKTR